MGCCSAFALVFLVAVNLIAFLGSAVLLAFGIVAKVSPDTAADTCKYFLPEASRGELQQMGIDISQIVITNAIFMIVIGIVGIFVAGVGFFGSCCTIRWMLIAYIVLMVIMLIAEIAPIVFAALYPQTFKGIVQSKMRKTLFDDFRQEIRITETKDVIMPTGAVELAWATVQLTEQCCGSMNWSDYSQFSWKNTGVVPLWTYPGRAVVPISCCMRRPPLTFPLTYVSFIDIPGCLAGKETAINTQNCYDAVEFVVQRYKGLAIGIAAGIAVIEVILIVTAIIRCERARKTTQYVKFTNN